MQNAKDYEFFNFIDGYLGRAVEGGLPADSAAGGTALALATATYEAADSRLEAGCTSADSHLGAMPFMDRGDYRTLLGILKTMAMELLDVVKSKDLDDHQLRTRTFELANALLAEARECGWGSQHFLHLQTLALLLMEQLGAR